VLYLHDGNNIYSTNYGSFGSWYADTTATREISQGRMRETILVGMDNNDNRFGDIVPRATRCSARRGWGMRTVISSSTTSGHPRFPLPNLE
jgi:hypothetical protein